MDEIRLISISVLSVALLLPFISELLAEQNHLLKWIRYAIFIVYVFANLYETILFRAVTPDAKYELSLLWSYKEALSVHNGGDSGLRILITDSGLLKEIILNILLYVPFGYLLPFTWPKLAQKKQEASGNRLTHCFWSIPWKVVLIGILCSTVTEVTQLVFHLGLFEYDDIFNNALGCLIGALIYNGFLRKHKERSAK